MILVIWKKVILVLLFWRLGLILKIRTPPITTSIHRNSRISIYSGDPKTGRSKSGIVQKPDVFDVQFSNGRYISQDRFMTKEKKYFSMKRSGQA